tara:strand:- start:1473 stop:2156 length:684 start_codon:yes stop_codon:yes gene_type:complete
MLGKASFIIVLLIVFQKLMKQFKILEGNTNNSQTIEKGFLDELVNPDLLDMTKFINSNSVKGFVCDREKYQPIESCFDMINNFDKSKIEETLLCIKLRLVSGSECNLGEICNDENIEDKSHCLENLIMDNLSDVKISNEEVFQTINSERNTEKESLSIFVTNKNLDRIIFKLKYNEDDNKKDEHIVNIIEKILYDQENIYKVLTDDEIEVLKNIHEYHKKDHKKKNN